MAPSTKPADGRRKSSGKTLIVTLRVNADKLRDILPASDTTTPAVDEAKPSPASSTDSKPLQPVEIDSNTATPQPDGTPQPGAMGPPGDGPKKKGVKRGAQTNGDLSQKQKGKPGPKKKPRLEDGTIDHAAKPAAHKLGPKANQGAINAGLRALDRSGTPCRRWQKGGFKLKSFTGVMWEIPRWEAPPKKAPESTTEDSAAASAADSSTKENKENAAGETSAANSNSGVDAEMPSAPPSNHASSPAPMAITAAS